ncbi:nucleotidyltransferase family protein [Vibrio sp. D404a]|uniref:nucleotidyltransferase family protein n=1 Tax=unclassified Vibrio TaxID=2614977 RepID=UPI0025566A73|nr:MULTISPECIES: nucleotidyltransferase family protein [unclassified Vibrio]MDK9736069.1 nucleotidyltransferase family protein [Vibrio sp. D404a]MDK9797765.1 nucleotidyltransferase family protein [Vibrio sp. D449a]
MKLAIMILAAGRSQRFNGCKLLAQMSSGDSLLSHSIVNATTTEVGDVYVVTGRWHDDIEHAQRQALVPPCKLLYCSEWSLGIGHSIAFGVGCLADDYDAILVTLADQVALTSETFKLLVSEYDGSQIVCAQYAGQCGVPALFPKRYFSKLMSLSGDSGAKKILHTVDAVKAIQVKNAEVDIDTKADLDRWNSLNT